MRILICLPNDLAAARGNSVAARRLKAGFEAAGHAVAALARCEEMTAAEAAARAAENAPDAVLVMHAWRCAAACEGIRAASDAPIVVSMRGTDANEMLYDAALGPAIRALLDACAAVVVFSEPMRAALAAAVPACAHKLHVIPNGLVIHQCAVDYRARLGLPAGALVFAGLGGLRAVKRTAWVAARVADLGAEFPSVHYLHAGPVVEPEEAEALDRLVRAGARVRAVGPIPHEETAAFLRASDIFVSGSRSEGMPHAVREAMILGVPALLSAVEGHLLMAEPEGEALFFDDGESFARQARRLVGDPALRARLGAAGRDRVRRALGKGEETAAYLRLLAAGVRARGAG
ncbi:MAG TPA: glycosyltransferase [Planctomycetota bacterium]|nr:glycosyltransferase family 4 protein [Planctomycetota bacterium]HNR99950.1 glycosyltransferase [Planctomycetota bacterium]HNU24820.1 glycosyltransferase [Planctomycetota bacterium]HOE29422.1 glycosyltransferase [Planctomycetota bacterium]HOE86067.1 glycosyltransferase [Planctomycetota bacterium]